MRIKQLSGLSCLDHKIFKEEEGRLRRPRSSLNLPCVCTTHPGQDICSKERVGPGRLSLPTYHCTYTVTLYNSLQQSTYHIQSHLPTHSPSKIPPRNRSNSYSKLPNPIQHRLRYVCSTTSSHPHLQQYYIESFPSSNSCLTPLTVLSLPPPQTMRISTSLSFLPLHIQCPSKPHLHLH
jgi:hypothetical protein